MVLDRQVVSVSGRVRSPVASIVKRFDAPERVLMFEHGRLEVITVGGRVIGKGSYEPGWRWSHASKVALRDKAPDHVGVVLSGRAKLVIGEDQEFDLTPGDFFHVATEYDSWVVGYRPCEVLYVSGVEALVNRLHRE
jgi:mannose-6-phosphate isomerase-like protein (cupin superfamily)